jgi:DNA-binding CsgD family transcriptional regulator
MSLLERNALLAQLKTAWDSARAGAGRLVFVEGEAGIGKTCLLRAFILSLDGSPPVFSGACEALQIPRPLGPLHDIAARAGDPLRTLLDDASERHRVFVAFLDLLRERPALVVLEDLHWADDATLDLLRYAGRRIERTHSLLVATYRTDELVPAHPLRAVLGDLATTSPLRLAPQPLSASAVRAMCSGFDVDALEVHARTGGNPFFVTEVLAAPTTQVPTTVQDAVLSRAGRLSASARAVLDAAAIAGPRVEPVVLETLAAAESAAIEEGLATGVLCVDGGAITFRHELARQAVLSAMTPTRAMSLHRMTHRALLAKAMPHAYARLALHAEGAGDAEAVRRWAPLAAREAAARGAHMQAAQQWARALAHTEGEEARAQVLDAYADELRTCGMVEPAVAAKERAALAWRSHGREREAIASFADLARMQLLASREDLACKALEEARALLPPDPDAPQRFRVDICEADVRRQMLDYRAAIGLARPVVAHAENHDDRALQLEALNTLGSALVHCGDPNEGITLLRRSLAMAESSGADLWGAMTLSLLALSCTALLRLDEAQAYLERGVRWCAERELDAPRLMQTTMSAGLHLLRGRWNEAAAAVDEVIRSPRAMPIALVRAHTLLGRLRARRGDAGAREAFAQALRLGHGSRGSVVTAHVSHAELAWLDGRDDDAAHEARAGLALAQDIGHRGLVGELRMWLQLSGQGEAASQSADDHPCALQAAGRWQEAAIDWQTLGCPYETARALSQGDERAQREALAIAESLGAQPLAQRLRRRLHLAGVRDLPRGPRASTRGHPAGLTSKEVAVLALVASGLRNKEIAIRLSRSPRTIDHHLESIFVKLGVATRAEAVSAAFRLGLVDGAMTAASTTTSQAP